MERLTTLETQRVMLESKRPPSERQRAEAAESRPDRKQIADVLCWFMELWEKPIEEEREKIT